MERNKASRVDMNEMYNKVIEKLTESASCTGNNLVIVNDLAIRALDEWSYEEIQSYVDNHESDSMKKSIESIDDMHFAPDLNSLETINNYDLLMGITEEQILKSYPVNPVEYMGFIVGGN